MKNIIYISPGPTYKPQNKGYQKQYKKLSEKFAGYIWTTSSKPEQLNIGNFKFKAMQSNYSLVSNLKFFAFCLLNAIKIRKSRSQIHLVTTYDPLKTGLIGLVVARITGAKFAPEVNGVYTSEAEWLDMPNSISNKIKKTVYPIIMRFVLKKADGIKLLFKDQIRPFNKLCSVKTVRSFHCFVPTSQFHELPENKVVLFAGFPFKRKGVDILIEAFKKIAPKYPDWKLKILGWYPDPTELNKAIGGHPQIYHHPPVHYPEMPEHIGTCAILVLPSRSEAMGRVLVEAMTAGKPRIGADVDGIPTVINDGIDGLLVKPEDVDDLASKLDMLMGNKELRKKLGEAGAKRVKQEFTEEAYINNVINFYKEVIGSGHQEI